MSETSKQGSSKKHDPGARKSAATDPELANEGEGSRSGTRRYDAGAERAASNPAHVEEAAKKAKEALEGPEGEELRRADERGKKGQHR